jgi:transcriptional regulator with XRE-family HTH domain
MSINVLRNLKSIREKRGYSQSTLAKMSGLSKKTIQRAENGDNVSSETVKSIVAALDLKNENTLTQRLSPKDLVISFFGYSSLSILLVFLAFTVLILLNYEPIKDDALKMILEKDVEYFNRLASSYVLLAKSTFVFSILSGFILTLCKLLSGLEERSVSLQK